MNNSQQILFSIDRLPTGTRFLYGNILYMKTTDSSLCCRAIALRDGHCQESGTFSYTGHIYVLPANGKCIVVGDEKSSTQ